MTPRACIVNVTVPLTAALVLGALSLTFAPSVAAQVRPGTGGFGARSTPTDDALHFHVLSRTSFGATPESLARIRAMGVDAYLWEQLNPDGVDDSAVEARLASELPAPSDVQYQWAEMKYAFLVRSAHSQRQLQAVMTQFWENHFTTVVAHGNSDVEYVAWSSMERTS